MFTQPRFSLNDIDSFSSSIYDQTFDNKMDPTSGINSIPFQYSSNQTENNTIDLVPEIIVVNSVGQVTANQNTFDESVPNPSLLV